MVDGIFKFDIDTEYLYILAVNILPYGRIKHITLKPILDNKAFINGNYCIIKNIFLDQLLYNHKTAFNN